MGFKRVRYDSGEEVFELEIKSGGAPDRWVVMKSDFLKVVDILKRKYGLTKDKRDRDLDWAL